MIEIIDPHLDKFRKQHKFNTKGPLSVALHVTRYAIERGLPISPDDLIAQSGTQVSGLSKVRIQGILADYGISQVLAKEGGRTSRGSVSHMRLYVDLLNTLNSDDLADLPAIEGWWIQRVREFFEAKPLQLNMGQGRSFEAIIVDLLRQAEMRQQGGSGTTYRGTVLQHLIGAKLEIALGNHVPQLVHHGASVADESSDRTGDFQIDSTVFHVTLTPGESVMQKCITNLERGLRPILVTTFSRTKNAHDLAHDFNVRERVEVIPAEQFLASNLHEWVHFRVQDGHSSIRTLATMYNAIVQQVETDLSLLIDI